MYAKVSHFLFDCLNISQVYDYALTFSQEVELIWASRWTLMKCLFLLDRYLVVPNLVVQQLRMFWTPLICIDIS